MRSRVTCEPVRENQHVVTQQRDAGGPLNTAETAVLRGIAILVIVLHNFLHVMPQSPGENEMDFDARRGAAVVELASRTNSAATPRLLFWSFGHYGVQIFIFLSAYGLTRKFAARVPDLRRVPRKPLRKNLPAVSVGHPFLPGVGRQVVRPGLDAAQCEVLWYGKGSALLLKLTLLSSVLPEQAFRPVGPWWFVPFIFQFYAVFPLLFAAERRWGSPVLVGFSVREPWHRGRPASLSR